jgi:pseudouridylate synthase
MSACTIAVAAEVAEAVAAGRAVVALESTIIAHGLPYPDSHTLAVALEEAVRAEGAVPATIALLGGTPRVGLDAGEIEALARAGAAVAKAGAADLAAYIAAGADAATTVSATSLLAARAGIRLFATGGIGGVHRGDAGDVSSDLTALATLPVAVVSAGAKAILDLPRTLEALESLGVLVVGYGTDELPAFYSRSAGLPLEHRADDPAELARILRARFDLLGQRAGVLVANPIPADAEIPRAEIEPVIAAALDEAARAGVAGKRLTPFLLDRLARATAGRTVTANRALALSNARLAARVAVALAEPA